MRNIFIAFTAIFTFIACNKNAVSLEQKKLKELVLGKWEIKSYHLKYKGEGLIVTNVAPGAMKWIFSTNDVLAQTIIVGNISPFSYKYVPINGTYLNLINAAGKQVRYGVSIHLPNMYIWQASLPKNVDSISYFLERIAS